MRASVQIVRCCVALLTIMGAHAAHAFGDATGFFVDPVHPHGASLSANGEGVYYTGAPRFGGLECSTCHTSGPQKVGISVAADDPLLLTIGYQAGHTYALDIELTGETLGLAHATPLCTDHTVVPFVPCNDNAFVLEIDGESGAVSDIGRYCAEAPGAGGCAAGARGNVVVSPDGVAVLSDRSPPSSAPIGSLVNGAVRWQLWWTAPETGNEPLALYVAAVDGNGGSGTAKNDQDPYGDDTAATRIRLPLRGAAGKAGCTMSGRGTSSAPALWILFLGCVIAWRRRARSVGLALPCFALGLLAGCNGALMTPGEDCLSCHSAGGSARAYAVAGTVFSRIDDPVIGGISNVEIVLTDAEGRELRLRSNEVGNFYTDKQLSFPITAAVERAGAARHMEPSMLHGSCNRCHAVPATAGADGRVHINGDDPVAPCVSRSLP